MMNSVDKKLAKKFEDFLVAGGAEVLPTTNAWELARFRTSDGVCVVYQNKNHRLSYSSEYAHSAYTAFVEKRKWTAGETTKRVQRKSVEELLVERDGCACFYCGTIDFSDNAGKPTLEHLLSISDGGSNHLSNLVLACRRCNLEAGSMPIVHKVKLRDSLRKDGL